MTELDLAVLDQRIADAQEDEIAAKTDADAPEGGAAGGRSEAGPGGVLGPAAGRFAATPTELNRRTGSAAFGARRGICYNCDAERTGYAEALAGELTP